MFSDIEIMSKRKYNQPLKHKPINKMDLQGEIRIALTEKKTTT